MHTLCRKLLNPVVTRRHFCMMINLGAGGKGTILLVHGNIKLEHSNGKVLFPSNIVHSFSSLYLFMDASNLGFGCPFGNKWLSEEFSSEWFSHRISVREFLPIVIVFELWILSG